MLLPVKELKERNKQIVKAYAQGYSQHMIAKVLGLSQPAVYGVIKRTILSLSPDPKYSNTDPKYQIL